MPHINARIVAIIACAIFLSACGKKDEQEVGVFTLPNTEVYELHSEEIGQTYEIRVALPDGYGEEDAPTTYPLLVLLDADYSFAIARNVTQHLAQRNQLPAMITVAIAYPGAEGDRDHYRMTRSRDYTPVFSVSGGYGEAFQVNSGGGPAFLRFIENELFSDLEARYTVDSEDRTLSGHSYGGLFTSWALLTRPDLFARWVIISPSYWYQEGYIFDYESSIAVTNTVLDEVVFMGVGSWENQPQNGRPMVDELNLLAGQLNSRGYQGLALDTYVFGEETHASIWPAAFSRGMRSVHNEPLPGTAVSGAPDEPAGEPAAAPDPVDDAATPGDNAGDNVDTTATE